MNEEIKNILIESGTKIILMLVPLLSAIAALYITKIKIYFEKKKELVESQIQSIKNEEDRTLMQNQFDILDSLIKTFIANAENTLKPQILQKISDGKVTKDELKSLAEIVKNQVIAQLPNEGKTLLEKSLGNLEDYVEARIEKILAELKDRPDSVVEHTVIETIAEKTESESKVIPE